MDALRKVTMSSVTADESMVVMHALAESKSLQEGKPAALSNEEVLDKTKPSCLTINVA